MAGRRLSTPAPLARQPALLLDAEAIRRAASGDGLVRAWLERIAAVDGLVALSALSVADALGGRGVDQGAVHLVLAGCVVVPLDEALALHAAALCRRLPNGQIGVDAAVVAATAEHLALRYERPVVLLAGRSAGAEVAAADMPSVFVRSV